MYRRAVLTGCVVVGALVGVVLVLRAGSTSTSALTTQPVSESSRLLAVLVYGIFGALSGWTLGSVVLYLIPSRWRREL